MRRRWSVLAITTVSVIGIQTAQGAEASNDSAETAEVTVTGEATGSLTSVSPEESAKQKTQVPGAFTVKTTDDMKLGRASNFEDLLQRTPGVFLQSENGAEVSKISIRGSGITSEDEPLGVMFLLDGLNFNQGDGESVLEDFDVAALQSGTGLSGRRCTQIRRADTWRGNQSRAAYRIRCGATPSPA